MRCETDCCFAAIRCGDWSLTNHAELTLLDSMRSQSDTAGRRRETRKMPTYYCTSIESRLSAQQNSRIASESTRVHAEVTGAPTYFAQVIFDEGKSGTTSRDGALLTHNNKSVYVKIV